ncbi:aminoacetone oxidase family FAD-binding enzyme [Candidatus Gracilibacteria bacterium]|nr:aminoacetone oxidase family FAD-binding enzyme [Candidatus Gracilibacteria bacterium]
MKKIAVVGAGPAGIYTSILLKDFPVGVTLFEQNKSIGEKLKLTGGGRMNITNKVFSVDKFSSSQPKLLKHFFKNPIAKNPESIFSELGIEWVWEENRAILASGEAVEEVFRLKNELEQQKNVNLVLGSKVSAVTKKGDLFELTVQSHGKTSKEVFDVLILMSGGMFRVREFGDKEQIYTLPISLGHKIQTITPSLSPLSIEGKPFRALAGISLRVELTDIQTKKSLKGDLVLTHFGISGPVVLDFSSMLSGTEMEMNFLPDILESDFVEKFQVFRQGKHFVRTFLKAFLPQRVVDFLLEFSQIEKESLIADISKEKLKKLRRNLFRYELNNVSKQDFSACWTTKGGVDLAEVSLSTLESKKHQNLFFGGEILDIDGLCGGYNISFAAICAKIVTETLKKLA